jgi:AcrR family transcriptional regulator
MPTSRPASAREHRSPRPVDDDERPDRRLAILTSAERLFAEHGFAGVSIRSIAAEAGVPSGLVGYYFGRKNELLDALLQRRRDTIEERIRGIHVALESPGEEHEKVSQLVRAWAEPSLRLRAAEDGADFSRLVARSIIDRGPEARLILERFYDPLADTFIDAMHAALPESARVDVVWGYTFALGALAAYIAGSRVHRLSHGEAADADPAAAERLIDFMIAGFDALLH